METLDIFLRLGAAAVLGCALGVNRDLHGKPMGVRTLGLVSVGAALVVLAVGGHISPDTSRVIQGIVTGIGFLGVGVIVRNQGQEVHGLTTAACAWVTACIGAACGIAQWTVVLIGAVLVFAILVLGGPVEAAIYRWISSRWPHEPGDHH